MNKKIIISVLMLITTLLFVSSCKPVEKSKTNDYTTRSFGFRFMEPKQSQFLKILDNEKVDYVIDSNGSIRVNLDQYAKFLGIKRVFRHGEELNPYIFETIAIFSREMEDRYIEEFNNTNVPYSIKKNGEHKYFSISQEYSPIYDQIVQKIYKEFRRKWK